MQKWERNKSILFHLQRNNGISNSLEICKSKKSLPPRFFFDQKRYGQIVFFPKNRADRCVLQKRTHRIFLAKKTTHPVIFGHKKQSATFFRPKVYYICSVFLKIKKTICRVQKILGPVFSLCLVTPLSQQAEFKTLKFTSFIQPQGSDGNMTSSMVK